MTSLCEAATALPARGDLTSQLSLLITMWGQENRADPSLLLILSEVDGSKLGTNESCGPSPGEENQMEKATVSPCIPCGFENYSVPVDVLPTQTWCFCCGFAIIHEDAVDNGSTNVIPGSVWWHALQSGCSSRLLCFCFLWHTGLARLYDNMIMLPEGNEAFITTTTHVPLSNLWLPRLMLSKARDGSVTHGAATSSAAASAPAATAKASTASAAALPRETSVQRRAWKGGANKASAKFEDATSDGICHRCGGGRYVAPGKGATRDSGLARAPEAPAGSEEDLVNLFRSSLRAFLRTRLRQGHRRPLAQLLGS